MEINVKQMYYFYGKLMSSTILDKILPKIKNPHFNMKVQKEK